MRVDGHALHALHDEVRPPARALTSVEELGDVGMGQLGEDLSFRAEAALGTAAQELNGEDFEGPVLVERLFHPSDVAHDTHASTSQLADHLPHSEPGAGGHATHRVALILLTGEGIERARPLVGREQGEDLLRHTLVPGVSTHPARPLDRVLLEGLEEELLYRLPARVAHADASSCWVSQARATVQSRFTVAGDMPMAVAVSRTPIPPNTRHSTT